MVGSDIRGAISDVSQLSKQTPATRLYDGPGLPPAAALKPVDSATISHLRYWQETMEIRLKAQNRVLEGIIKYFNNPIIIILSFEVQSFQFLVRTLAFLPTNNNGKPSL